LVNNWLYEIVKVISLKIIVSDGMGNDEEKEIDTQSITGKELLEKLDISVFVATIMKNNEIVGENQILTSHDRIKILNMIHGG
jgi:sulfur carrier protein ThiS